MKRGTCGSEFVRKIPKKVSIPMPEKGGFGAVEIETWAVKCDLCGAITYSEEAKKFLEEQVKLLSPTNHTQRSFVYKLVHEAGKISTPEVKFLCLRNGISCGDRELRKLQEADFLSSYYEKGSKIKTWTVKVYPCRNE